jgi:hypothetical protein
MFEYEQIDRKHAGDEMNAKRFGNYGGFPRLAHRQPDYWIA